MIRESPDPSLPGRLREFHERLPLAGDPPNAVLSLPDDRILYLAAILRDTPVPAPALSLEEWQAFLDHLRPHGVYPLIAYRLRSWPEDCRPPAKVMAWLNRVFLYAAARTMRAGRQIQEVVDALEEAGIPSVLLKGPALARTVYPDPALRQSVDIDLLVRPADVPAAEAVLEGLGYSCPTKYFHLTPTASNNETFGADDGRMPVELHWRLDFALDLSPGTYLEGVISRRVPVESDGLSFATLWPADHLLYLAFHDGFQHSDFRLDWALDLAMLMPAVESKEDWDRLVRASVDLCTRDALELTTATSALWTGADVTVPPGTLDYAAWPAATERERGLWDHSPAHHNSLVSYAWLMLQGQQGPAAKVRWAWRFVFPPAEMLVAYRRSGSRVDIPIAHFRRWVSIIKYV
jgi:hypothetical protein